MRLFLLRQAIGPVAAQTPSHLALRLTKIFALLHYTRLCWSPHHSHRPPPQYFLRIQRTMHRLRVRFCLVLVAQLASLQPAHAFVIPSSSVLKTPRCNPIKRLPRWPIPLCMQSPWTHATLSESVSATKQKLANLKHHTRIVLSSWFVTPSTNGIRHTISTSRLRERGARILLILSAAFHHGDLQLHSRATKKAEHSFSRLLFPPCTRKRFTASQISRASAEVCQSSEANTNRMRSLFRGNDDEQLPVPIKTSTQLPDDMPAGALLRVGPNQRGDCSCSAFFDGDGMVNCVVFNPKQQRTQAQDGWYSRAWIRTAAFVREEQKGKIYQDTIGNTRGWGVLSAMLHNMLHGGQACKDSCNTALRFHGGTILALMEQNLPSELAVSTQGHIETVRCAWDLDGAIPDLNMAAHSRADPLTGERMSFSYSVFPSLARHDVFSPDGSLTHQAVIPLPSAVIVHDIAISRSFSVLLDFPLSFRFSRMLAGEFPMQYNAAGRARIGLLPRYGSWRDVQYFDVSPGVVLHTINAFERDDGAVVVQALRAQPDGPSSFPHKLTPSFPYEWVLDLNTGHCRAEYYLADVPAEFPTMHPDFVGLDARFAYCLSPLSMGPITDATDGGLCNRVIKLDLRSGGVAAQYTLPHGVYFTSEPTVVPKRRRQVAEDACFLLLFTTTVDCQGNKGGSTVLVLDAEALHSGPVADVPLPSSVPMGLHGVFVPWQGLRPKAQAKS